MQNRMLGVVLCVVVVALGLGGHAEVPKSIAGMMSTKISPDKSLTIRTDARKWEIDGGWKPGRYEVTVRVEHLSVDGARCQLSVCSPPFEFEVK